MSKMMSSALVAMALTGSSLAVAPGQDPMARYPNEIKWDLKTCNGESEDNAMLMRSTEFGKIACELAARNSANSLHVIQPNCLPKVHFPPEEVETKGAVLIFHGYTACPDQFSEIASELAAAGMYVFTPLSPGHGREYNEFMKGGDDYSELPTRPSEYADYVKQAVANFKEDTKKLGLHGRRLRFGTFGISLGAAMAARALVDDEGEFFTNGLIGSAHFGLTPSERGGASRGQIKIMTSSVLGMIGNWLPESMQKLLTSPVHWGPECDVEQRQRGRGGICQFEQKNMMAASSFADDTWQESQNIDVRHLDSYAVSVDGPWNNAMAVGFLRKANADTPTRFLFWGGKEKDISVGMCIFPGPGSWCQGSTCGVPHSNVARAEAESKKTPEKYVEDPFWWWDNRADADAYKGHIGLKAQIVDSLVKDVHVGHKAHNIIVNEENSSSESAAIEVCYTVDNIQDDDLPEKYFDQNVLKGNLD